MGAPAKAKGTYTVLNNLHHQDEDTPKGGKFFRRGDKVKLSEEHAAPLVKGKVVEPVKGKVVEPVK
jgi:hypothetical protein